MVIPPTGEVDFMAIALGENRYGKSRVRVMKVYRVGARHEVIEWNVEVWLTGDFRSCFEDGDNSRILPTDTMKNTVYSLARSSSAKSVEGFGQELVSHFIETNPYADAAGVHIVATPWRASKASRQHLRMRATNSTPRQLHYRALVSAAYHRASKKCGF